MNIVDEINYGVEAFHSCLIQALSERLLEVEARDEDVYATLKLGRIEDFIGQIYPTDQAGMRNFQSSINQIGATKTDELAAKISQTIFDFLGQGVTPASMGRGELAKLEELERWTTYKSSEQIWYFISTEAGLDDTSLAGTYTQEFCWVMAAAGVNFFKNKHNISGKAIQSGFICGIGTLRLWLQDDLYHSLIDLPA